MVYRILGRFASSSCALRADASWSLCSVRLCAFTFLPFLFQSPPVLHYVWCGKDREFKFPHYVGFLSALRVLRPLKVFFHYTHNLPVVDKHFYNTWFDVSWNLIASTFKFSHLFVTLSLSVCLSFILSVCLFASLSHLVKLL